MKKFILILFAVVGLCAVTTQASALTEVSLAANKEQFDIEVLEEFYDPNILNYTIEEIYVLIAEQEVIQDSAHTLAETARSLGWPEDSETILLAKTEYDNATLIIKYYQARLEDIAWEKKAAEYPTAVTIWRYMKSLGWNDYVCAGIMGNIMNEVGGNTLNLRYWLYGSNYYGICQWNKAYKDKIWGADLKTQCDFLRDTIKYELDTFGYAYSKEFDYSSFLALTNAKDAADAFARCYERCSNKSYEARKENAMKAYQYFVN